MIELDKYESQLMLLSKGHFNDEIRLLEISDVEACRAIWAWRCGVLYKYVEDRFIVAPLIKIFEKLGYLNTEFTLTLMEEVSQFPKNNWRYTSREIEKVSEFVIVMLLGKLSCIQVCDILREDDIEIKEALFKYHEKTIEFLDVFKETNNE